MFLPGLVLLVCVWSPVEPACGPVEEGQPTTLTCNVNTAGCNPSSKVLDWRAQTIYLADVISCFTDACGGGYSPNFISATISPTKSTLTINNVSRTVPFNMETKWTCHPCSPRPTVTVCDKLQVYAKPSSPSCMVTENLTSGKVIMSVTVTCSTDRVYPAAKCKFYKISNGGQPVQITQTIDYQTPTPTSTTPVYYSSECSVSVPVQELGEGTHRFQGFIYPDVTGGQRLVDGITPDKTVTLSFPEASHTCTTNTVQGYFLGKSARCTCTITSDSSPRGTAQWYRGDNPVGTTGTLDVTYDKNNAVQTYTCEAESNLGRKVGSTLIARFACDLSPSASIVARPRSSHSLLYFCGEVLDLDSVQVEPTSSPINLCDDNYKTAQMTCRISKENVSPAPTFSFSRNGLTFEDPQPGTESSDGIYYQREFSFSQDVGGEYPVYCRVVNTFLNPNQQGDTRVTFQKPPPGPAHITVDGQSYQGTAQSNIVTLIEGYTGNVTCLVEGGYPSVTNTHLKCGQREITGDRNTATLSFTDNPLRRDMDGKECSCTSQHVTGCYSNRDTKLTLDVTFLDLDSVQVEPTSSPINLCDDNYKTAQVTCRISKENVSPAPTFSFSRNGLTFEDPQPGTESSDGIYYQREFSFSQDVGGEYPVYCRVVNTILNPNQQGDTRVTFQKPPPGPAHITVDGQSYQGTAQSNIVTLIEGYTGNVTCLVEGGYPSVTNTHLKCGQREITGDRNTATLSFTDNPLRRDMDGKECSCTSQHVTGCYSNRDTKLTLDVTYLPELTFTKDSTETIFDTGDRVVLTCSVQGNPDPSLMLTRKRPNEVLAKVQTTTLTHTLNSLDCLDTGVYVCSGQNSRGTNSKNISIKVRCPQQLNPNFDPPSIIDAEVGDNAQTALEIYGFPEPRSLYLQKEIDNTKITSYPRHTVKYTPKDVPFGVVTVTIFDIVDTEYTHYTLTVDNGVGEALLYKFYLNKGKGMNDKPGGDSLNIPAIIIGVIALVILATSVVINIFLVRRNRNLTKWKVKDPDLYLVPINTPYIVNTVQSPGNPRPGQYEDVDGVQYTTGSTPIPSGLTPGSIQDRDTNATLTHTHTAMVSASQPPETNHYETLPDNTPTLLTTHMSMVSASLQPPETNHYETLPDNTPTSGPYNSTSPQDVEPPNIYRRPITDTSSTRHDTPSGDYNNIPGQHGEAPDSHISSPSAGAVMTSLPNRSYNNAIIPSIAGGTRDDIDVKQVYQNVKLK